jgi:hypothetical protein
MILDLLRALLVSRDIERDRQRLGPHEIVMNLRRRGMRCRKRDAVKRVRLEGIIRLVDRLFLVGPNCYRRALIEIAMDAGAAAETLHLGIDTAGDLTSGHAWLGPSSDRAPSYHAEFSL